MTAYAIAKEVLPELDADALGAVLWNLTGYPCFWSEWGRPVEEQLRDQLATVRRHLDSGVSIEEQIAAQWRVAVD